MTYVKLLAQYLIGNTQKSLIDAFNITSTFTDASIVFLFFPPHKLTPNLVPSILYLTDFLPEIEDFTFPIITVHMLSSSLPSLLRFSLTFESYCVACRFDKPDL